MPEMIVVRAGAKQGVGDGTGVDHTLFGQERRGWVWWHNRLRSNRGAVRCLRSLPRVCWAIRQRWKRVQS